MKLDEARLLVEQADYVIMAIVEMIRGAQEPGDASAAGVADHIRNAPISEVQQHMLKLHQAGLLEVRQRPEHPVQRTYMLTHMGAELMIQDVGNWEQASREQERRERELALITRL